MNKQKLLNHLQSTDTKYGKALKLFEYLAETYNQEVDFWERVDEEILLLGKNHYWHPVLTPIKTSNLRLEDDIVEYWGLRKINHDLYDKKDYKIKDLYKVSLSNFEKHENHVIAIEETNILWKFSKGKLKVLNSDKTLECFYSTGLRKAKDSNKREENITIINEKNISQGSEVFLDLTDQKNIPTLSELQTLKRSLKSLDIPIEKSQDSLGRTLPPWLLSEEFKVHNWWAEVSPIFQRVCYYCENYFEELSEKDKRNYINDYPAPKSWEHYYPFLTLGKVLSKMRTELDETMVG